MKLLRIVVSDLHLGTGVEQGKLNPHEDFYEDDRFAELLAHYDAHAGDETEIELVLNGDIFDLLKVKVGGVWPIEITEEVAAEKLRACLDGHPRTIRALKRFVARAGRKLVYLPGNHDLDMCFPQA
ncbi:MAG TPA: metallophosphoesterase, partial [Polyangiales bacterium]|nr:metallophosphoesterase [Polyangiales bacterium]